MEYNLTSNIDTTEIIIPLPIESSSSLVELYTSIMQFQISDEDSLTPFHVKLARENGWQHDYAKRVEFEYKRFLFLTVSAGHSVSPSDPVDQAWHLHLTCTRSYWDGMCHEILGKPLHHTPSRGGPAEVRKFDRQYLKTIMSYERMFGVLPGKDIWPAIDCEPEGNPKFQRISTRDHWVIRKPIILKRVAARIRIIKSRWYLVLTGLILAGIFTNAHATKSNDNETIEALIIPLVIALFVYAIWNRYIVGQKCPECKKWQAMERTNQIEKRGFGKADLEEWQCRNCGHITWEEEPQCGG